MPPAVMNLTVRLMDAATSIISIVGEFSIFAEGALIDAYTRACGSTTRTIILDFTGLEYMNSGGIGLLVTLLLRMQRQGQRLLAFGLSEHYQYIFEITRLSKLIELCDTEAAALTAARAF